MSSVEKGGSDESNVNVAEKSEIEELRREITKLREVLRLRKKETRFRINSTKEG